MINQEKNFLKFQRSENNSRTGTEIVTKIFFLCQNFAHFFIVFLKNATHRITFMKKLDIQFVLVGFRRHRPTKLIF
jgi:hypothetical protein